MNITANKKFFSTSKTFFHSYNSSFKSSKSVDSLKTMGIATKVDTKTELVNSRNNTAPIKAKNIPSKRNIKNW